MIRSTLALVSAVTVGLASCGSAASNRGTQIACGRAAIAYLGPLTGEDAVPNTPERNAVALQVEQYNESHEDCQVGFVEFNAMSTDAENRALAERIAGDPEIVGVVGPVWCHPAFASMPVFDAAGLSVVSPEATNVELTTKGWKTFHRVVRNDGVQGPSLALFAVKSLGATRVAIIDDGTAYGAGVATAVEEAVLGAGVEVVHTAILDAEDTDYREVVSDLVGAKVDVLLYGGLDKVAARLVQQADAAGLRVPMVGSDGLLTSTFAVGAGAASDGDYATCPCVPSEIEVASSRHQTFITDYQSRFGELPPRFAAESAEAAAVLLEAIANGNRSRDGITDYLRTIDMAGITKRIQFTATGDISDGPVFVYQVRNGAFVPVARVTSGKLELVEGS